jgi:hypothetical protein
MMAQTSLLAAALLGLAWARGVAKRPLGRTEWTLAVAFAVLIDLDHLENLPRYLATHGGVRAFDATTALHWGMQWQGFLHTPWALVLVVPACLVFRSLVPAAFWGLHMVLDFVVATKLVVWGSADEWLLDAALAVALAVVLALSLAGARRSHAPGLTWRRHLAVTFALAAQR